MQERYAFPLRSYPRRLIDQANARGTASVESSIQVLDREADVMYAGSALCDKSPYG